MSIFFLPDASMNSISSFWVPLPVSDGSSGIVFGSVLQPAYSFFSGYFRFASMIPYLYKIPGLTLNNKLLPLFGFLYLIFGLSLLFAWFF